MNLDKIPCPLCGQQEQLFEITVPDADLHMQKYGMLYSGMSKSEWKVCGRCGFVHQNPRPSKESLNEFYLKSKYHDSLVGKDVDAYMRFATWYYHEKITFCIAKSGMAKGKVFDIGCGQGGVLKIFEELGWDAYGVEPDQDLARFAKDKLRLRGVRQGVLDGSYELGTKVDLIFSNHAFEHFPGLDDVMLGIAKILRPGGFVFTVVPTYYSNRSSLSKKWMNSSHYSLFNHSSLNQLYCRYGIEEITHTYRGWWKEIDELWYLGKFVGSCLAPEKFFENPEEIDRYLRFVNPVRSLIFFPIYSKWSLRVRLYSGVMSALGLLFSSPRRFLAEVFARINILLSK